MEEFGGLRSSLIRQTQQRMTLKKPHMSRPSQTQVNLDDDEQYCPSDISESEQKKPKQPRIGEQLQVESEPQDNEEKVQEQEKQDQEESQNKDEEILYNEEGDGQENKANSDKISAEGINIEVQQEEAPSIQQEQNSRGEESVSKIQDSEPGQLQIQNYLRNRMNSKNFLASHFFVRVEKRRYDKFSTNSICPGCEELYYSLEKMPYELQCGDDQNGKVQCQECWLKAIEQGEKNNYVICKVPHSHRSIYDPTPTGDIARTALGRSAFPQSSGFKLVELVGSKYEDNFFEINFLRFKSRYDLFELCRKEISHNFQEQDDTPAPVIKVLPEVSEFQKNCTLLPCGDKIMRTRIRGFFNRPIYPLINGQVQAQIEVACTNQKCRQIFLYPKYDGETEESFVSKYFPNPRKLAAQNFVLFENTHYLLEEEILDVAHPDKFKKADEMLQIKECVVCTKGVYELNEMHQIFGISHLHVCYECLCLRCVETYPPMDWTEFDRSQKISFLGKVERATFTVPGFQHLINLKYYVVPSYPNQPFSHVHFMRFVAKQYRNKVAIRQDLEMNQQLRQIYASDMRREFLENISKYLTCAVCELEKINYVGSGYKLRSSFRSYVCGKCVEAKQKEIERDVVLHREKYQSTREVVMKFESSRDGILSYFLGKIHFGGLEDPPYIYYDMEEARELIGYFEQMQQPRAQLGQDVAVPDEVEIECYNCFQHFNSISRAPKIICPNKHCICFECLCSLVFGYYQSKNIPRIICGVCIQEGEDVTYERVGNDKINLQNLFQTDEELVEKARIYQEHMKN